MFIKRKRIAVKTLCDLHQGDTGKIISIRGKVAEHRFLCFLGITIGRSISVEKVIVTPRERIITIVAGDIDITLDKTLTHNIQVEVPIFSS